ncbi:MAG: alpha/beta hydrolase family protein [Pirellulaceae bacterium]
MSMKLGRFVVGASHAVALLALLAADVSAAGPDVVAAGETPDDARLDPLKDLNGYFPFTPSESPEAWQKRAGEVRRQMRVALGLWPMPTKTPLNAVVHGKVDRDEYTVERVYFESMPGLYVTGSLYRPKSAKGKVPGVLCPHGHFGGGRFHDAGEAQVKQSIAQGAERFEEGGRSPLQARCVQLARMGCIVFHYDMLGYADSGQISFELAHRFGKQRPEMNSPTNWGLFSPQAEEHLQSIMGLQAYNSVRALDFLTSLDGVDPRRLAVTGASGGGTQTFTIAAIDPRVAVAFPAVMVSTAMQGGCTCENCSLFRVGTGNVEFAALFAPKPQAMTSADDWTKEMETKGFPELQAHYKMLGAPDNVSLAALTQFKHNYNYVSRAAMYDWFNKHLGLGHEEPIVEQDYQRLTSDEMTVWNDDHPQPEGGDAFERKLLRWWTDDANQQIAALRPKDESSLKAYREVVGTGIDVVIGRGLPESTELEYDQTHKVERGDVIEMAGLLRNKTHGEELPIAFLYPKQWEGRVTIWLSDKGKAGLYQNDGSLDPYVARLLERGVSVVGVDLLYQGEFLAGGTPIDKTPRVANPREAACYTFGFNSSVFAQRVHDVLTTIAFVRGHDYTPKRVDLVALDGTGPIAAAARAQARDAIGRAVIDTSGFRFGEVRDLWSVDFLPGGAKYDDLPGMLAVAAPGELLLAGEKGQSAKLVEAAYAAAGDKSNLTIASPDKQKSLATTAVEWLLRD